MMHVLEDQTFRLDMLHLFLITDLLLLQGFHGEQFTSVLLLHQCHLPESASPEHLQHVEIIESDLLLLLDGEQ